MTSRIALLHKDVDDLDVLVRLILFVDLDVLNRMDDLKPRQRTAEDCMLVVQPWCSIRRNEELTSVRVGAGVGHAQGVWPIMVCQ
jgi:hypothetical protein